MGGLRERKKNETREKILSSALKNFISKGFSSATTAELARDADIAEGTIYNYFSSKGEILIAIVQRAFFNGTYHFDRVPETERDVVAEIMKFLDHHLHSARDFSKSLLREVYALAFKPSGDGAEVLSELIRFDAVLLDQIREYITRLETGGLLKSPEKPELFLDIAYGIVMYQFGKYILVEEMTYSSFMEELTDKMRLLITGYINTSL